MVAFRGPPQFALAGALGAVAYAFAASDSRAAAFCAAGAPPRAAIRVPLALEAEVAKAFAITADMARDAAYARCVGSRLLACWVGANLNCGEADTRRSLPGAAAFCRSNPDADIVPMAATGHDTIYAWRCVGDRAVAGKAAVAVDAQGYVTRNWKELP
jgi:hypothetical protein